MALGRLLPSAAVALPSILVGLLLGDALYARADSVPKAFADRFGAKCLDGTAPYFDVALNASSTKWVLFLEGGGWCYGVDASSTTKSCAGRGGFVWPPTTEGASDGDVGEVLLEGLEGDGSAVGLRAGADIGGVMSQDPSLNPDFCSWNKLFVHYCDGASFGGGRIDPIAVSTKSGEPAKLWIRGRANFDSVISYFLTNATLGLGRATEVILSGGSAGGLAVFFNLDHLATLLPKGVRLVGFPDAGFFLDAKQENSDKYHYRELLQGADPVWNVTGSGGTNLKCLAANSGAEWKCLFAQYIVPHIETPIFVMNSVYDSWQMGNILAAECIPTPTKTCTGAQNASLRDFRSQFLADVAAVMAGKPKNGMFLDVCYVHEQNVDYCSEQSMPNCVGWSPLEPGSKKWGYTTAVQLPDGRSLTPQQAFSAWYKGERIVAIDHNEFFDNPHCIYLGHPKPAKNIPESFRPLTLLSHHEK